MHLLLCFKTERKDAIVINNYYNCAGVAREYFESVAEHYNIGISKQMKIHSDIKISIL